MAIVDIPNAFIQTVMEDDNNKVVMRVRGYMVDVLVKVAPEVYGPYVLTNKRGRKQLLVECLNAIYGTMVASLLYYRKFTRSLRTQGYTVNPYDPCVWNKMIKGKQITICFHVDDCKVSHNRHRWSMKPSAGYVPTTRIYSKMAAGEWLCIGEMYTNISV